MTVAKKKRDQREYNLAYYQKNKEKLKQRSRDWKLQNPERYKTSQSIHREANRERINRERRILYATNPTFAENIRAGSRAWGKENPERRRTKLRTWRERNPDKTKASLLKRYALTRGASDAELILRSEVYDRDNALCRYCGIKLGKEEWHLDHIVPVSKGGKHTKDNVCVSCPSCNLGKGNKINWSKKCV